jgi:aldose sugar dehydrogenase
MVVRRDTHMTSLRLTAALLAACLAGSPAVRAADEVVPSKSGPVNVEHLAALNEPWGMEFLPDGRLLVTEKPGNLRIYADGKLSEPIGGVPKVAYREQGGLLDVAIDPDFARNGLVYLSYAEAAETQPPNAQDVEDPRFGGYFDKEDNVLKGGAVARGRLDGAQLRDVKVIWRQVPKTIGRGHFGGRLAFAPDGKLFITSGDRMRFDPAQQPGSNLGKIVRINPDGSIPTDNPFAGKSGTQADIWSLGHRNPLGAAINPATRRLWVHEMGPLGGDELNTPEPGKNYGWPVVSNGDNYDNSPIPDHVTRPEFVAPVTYWFPVISPSGFIFYSGSRFPAWKGHALVGGLSSEVLLRLKIEGGRVTEEERLTVRRRIRDVAEAPDGSVWVMSDGKDGALLRLTPAPK